MTYEEIVKYVQKKAAKADVKNAEPVAIQVDIVGEGEGAFYVAVKEGKLEVEPYQYFDHDAKLVVAGDVLADVVDGKLDITKAMNEGKLRVEGNVEKVSVFKTFASKPAAKKAAPKAEAKKEAPKAAEKKETVKAAPAKKAAPKAEPKKEAPKAEVKKEAPKAEVKKEAPKAPAKKAAPKAAEKKETVKAAPKAPAKKATKKK